MTSETVSPSIKGITFEYCALRFLLQWHRREANLHRELKKKLPSLEGIRDSLRFFQVARNFAGISNDLKAKAVRQELLSIRARKDTPMESKVVLLADGLKRRGFKRNVSAASKLLWLSERKPFVIYDSRARDALRIYFDYMGSPGGDGDYETYCTLWRKAYQAKVKEISDAVAILEKAHPFLPEPHLSSVQVRKLSSNNWFKERVFDIYLWELGGDK